MCIVILSWLPEDNCNSPLEVCGTVSLPEARVEDFVEVWEADVWSCCRMLFVMLSVPGALFGAALRTAFSISGVVSLGI